MKHSTLTLVGIVCLSLAASLCGQQAAEPASPSSAGPAAMGNPSADGPLQQVAVPRLIKLDGVLRDLAGKPISGPVDVTFSLYPEQTGGAALWFETRTVQADSLGRYTVLLGAMTPAGVPLELFTAGAARWLGVQVANLAEQSRVLLVSVPYAMKAGDAETLGGKPASDYLLAAPCSVRQPTDGSAMRTSPLQPDCAAGTNAATLSSMITSGATTTKTSESPVTQATTQNYIPIFTDNIGTVGNSILTQSGTKLGVNTNAPAFNLDVNGNAFAVGPKAAAPGTGGTMRFRDDTGTQRWLFGIPGSAGSQDFQMYNYTNGRAPIFIQNGAASYSLYMAGTGNVGVGTTTPAQKLSVAGVVESTSGGFKFPDGTTQTTAATGGGGGGGTATDLTCAACVSSSEVNFNYAASASKGGDAANALLLNGLASSAFQPAGAYAALGANTFTSTQTISSGNLSLPSTTGSGSGVISLGGNPLIHAYGSNNLFVGKNAGNFSTTGSNNTGSGVYALFTNAEGNSNTAVGYSALLFNTSGYQNTAAGASALYSNTTGYQNTAGGEEALYSNTTGQNNTATGYFALKANISGNDNTAVGWSALSAVPYGVANTAVGSSALSAGSVGSFNTAIGAYAGPNAAGLSNSTAIGYNAKVSQSNSLILGGTGGDAVSVGIGLTAPAHALDVVGDVHISGCYLYGGSGSYGNCSSDARLKKNIQVFSPVLDRLALLEPVHFEWRDSNPPGYRYGPGQNTGLVAQQVEEVFPELISTDAHGYKRVNYGEIPFLLLEGVRELKSRNDGLRAQLEEQQKQIASLSRENAAKDAELAAVKIQIEHLRYSQTQLALAVARLAQGDGQTRFASARSSE